MSFHYWIFQETKNYLNEYQKLNESIYEINPFQKKKNFRGIIKKNIYTISYEDVYNHVNLLRNLNTKFIFIPFCNIILLIFIIFNHNFFLRNGWWI
jgi:hypothetical protein